MTKANPAYHKRDLYSDVTSRILSELADRCSTLDQTMVRNTRPQSSSQRSD